MIISLNNQLFNANNVFQPNYLKVKNKIHGVLALAYWSKPFLITRFCHPVVPTVFTTKYY